MSLADFKPAASDHAEQMDNMYRYQRHIYDLTRKYYLLGRDTTIAALDIPRGGSLLEVGCGTGRNLLLIHKLYPHAKLYGLDISAEMLTSAKANFRGTSLQPTLRVADATAFDPAEFGTEGFDRVMISYALSMIPDWEMAVERALASLRPGGSLHVIDFGQQENLPAWFGRMLKAWLARFHVTPRPDLREVLEAKAAAINARLEFKAIGKGYAWQGTIRT